MEVSASVDDKLVMVLLSKQEALEFYAWLKKQWPSSSVQVELEKALRTTLVKEDSSG